MYISTSSRQMNQQVDRYVVHIVPSSAPAVNRGKQTFLGHNAVDLF